MKKCQNCGTKVLPGSNYCPQCGLKVIEEEPNAIIPLNLRIIPVEISFGYSSSANYETVLELCKKLPTYQEEGEGKKKKHKITLPITEIELLERVLNIVGNWKSSSLLIDGKTSSWGDLVNTGMNCYTKRQEAFNPLEYCFGDRGIVNIWGCCNLGMPLDIYNGHWMSYGKFDNNGVWYFDKDRIKHDLELNIHRSRYCPVLNTERIFKTLDLLPNSVNPKIDKNWEYITDYDPNTGKDYAVGVKPLIRLAQKYVFGDYKPEFKDAIDGGSKSMNIKIDIDTSELEKEIHKTKDRKKSNTVTTAITIVVIFIFLILIFCLLLMVWTAK